MNLHRPPLYLLLIPMACVLLSSCDSNNGDDDLGDSLIPLANMIEASFTVFGDVAADIFTSNITKTLPTYTCEAGGQVEYTQSPVDQNIYELNFQECNGINGDVDLGLDVQVEGNTFGLQLLLDGSLEEACTLQFANFIESVTSSLDGEDQTIRLNGLLFSECDGTSFACSFINAELSEETTDTIFEESCSVTG